MIQLVDENSQNSIIKILKSNLTIGHWYKINALFIYEVIIHN